MEPVRASKESATATAILDAACDCLLADGYAGLSTRKVAQLAGVPLSQVHYHFGSKGGHGARPARGREPPPPGPPDRDVRRGRAAVAALRAGVRLPRRRPRVRVRPRAAGDDRRRVVDARHRRRGARPARRLVRPAHRGRHRGGRALRRARAVLAGRGRHAHRQRLPRVASRCCCSASTASPADPRRLRRVGDAIRWPRRREARRTRHEGPTAGRHRRVDARRRAACTGSASATATPTIALLPTWSILPVPLLEAAGAHLARHHRVVTFDGRGIRPLGPPAGAAAYTHLEFAADIAGGARRHRHRAGRPRRALVRGAPGRAVRRRPPGAGARASSPSARRCRWRRHSPDRRGHPFEDAGRRPPRAGRSTTPTTGSSDYERLPRVLRRADVHRAALDQAARGLRRRGASRPTRRCSPTPRAVLDGLRGGSRSARCARGCAAPCS